MKQSTFDNIKQLDISTGGGIISEKTRIDTINHPILVIGLGGTGTDALLRLKHQISRRFKLPENQITKQKKPKPDNIEFLSLETNAHEKKKYKGITLDPYTETVCLSNAAIGSILNNKSTMPDYISKWLSPELTITDGTKGASGNRQAGRLLLFEKINTAVDAIDNKIRTLRTTQENKLLVFILSGLSGGTGGGMFLDIAYIVRGILERDYGAKGVDKVDISGYLFTPDVHLAGNHLNIHTEEYIQRNGYAALKELDYFMNIEERAGERFSQRYGTRLEVNSPLAPFNLCHLVSACNIDGVHLKGAYDYALNVTAENIVNFLALEEKESGQEFAIQDYYSNLISNIATMKTTLPEGLSQSANFVYNIIGASAAVLPTEGINAYLAHALFTEMRPMLENMPDDHDLAVFAQTTKLEITQLGAELSRYLPPIKLNHAETDYYSYQNVIKTQRVNIDEKLTEQYNLAKRQLSQHRDVTESIVSGIKAELKTAFLNPKQGPIYTARLIHSTISPCILARLNTTQEHLKEKIAAMTEAIEAEQLSAEIKFDEARKAILFAKESKKNTYIESKIKMYQLKLQRDTLETLIQVYKDIAASLESENDKIYLPYTQALQAVAATLHQNADYLASPPAADSSKTYYNGIKTYHWDIIDIEDSIPAIDDAIKAAGTAHLIRDFAKSLLTQQEKWINDKSVNIPAAVSDFIYDQFSALSAQTMSQFLSIKYGATRTIEHITESDIAPRLFRDAKPIFDLNNTAGMYNFPSYGMVSVPYNSPDIIRGIEAHQSHALSNLRFNIRKSAMTDRIFWLNTQNGIPLFAYTPIKVYEELYERTIQTREGVGRHLSMTSQDNWTNLPSPIPENQWGDTYKNIRQKALNDDARAVFYQGLENGHITHQSGRYVCVSAQENEPEIHIYTGNAHSHSTESEALAIFLRSPNLINIVRHEVAQAQKLQQIKTEEDAQKHQIEDFLRILICEAIVKRGANYIYEKELEEDPLPPFVNLIDHADFPEYAMFKSYNQLSFAQQNMLKSKAKVNESIWSTDKLLLNLRKWQGRIAIRKTQLDQEMHKHSANMYNFYRNVLLRLNTQVTAMKGV